MSDTLKNDILEQLCLIIRLILIKLLLEDQSANSYDSKDILQKQVNRCALDEL